MRFVQGFVHGLRIWFSLMLMLAVMTYNAGVILSVVFGLAAGYLVLGFSPAEIIIAPKSNQTDQTNTNPEPSLEL